jgi:hypothetical protein
LAQGLLVVFRTPDAGALKAEYLSSGLSNRQPVMLSEDTDVATFEVASDEERNVAVAWEHFEPDAGAWVLRSRVVHVVPTPRNAGVMDGGTDGGRVDSGVMDAGVDAGLDTGTSPSPA